LRVKGEKDWIRHGRSHITAERYYFGLAVIASLALGFTCLSISAPIDRLIKAVEDAIPEDNRVPFSICMAFRLGGWWDSSRRKWGKASGA
jgi:hypothetical protein